MANQFRWYTQKTTRLAETIQRLALIRIANRWTEIARELVSEPFPPASKPGEAPRKRTGILRAGIGHAPLGFGGRRMGVGGLAYYGRFLELGTAKLRPRPFLRPALYRLALESGNAIRGINLHVGMK